MRFVELKTQGQLDVQTLHRVRSRLPTIKQIWGDFTARAVKEGWPASRFLAALAEHELAERDRRRIERHLAEAHLSADKTLDCFAFDVVP